MTRQGKNMPGCVRSHIAAALFTAALLLSIIGGARDAGGYSAVETLSLNTHGLMLREAYSQLSAHPAFKNSRFLAIDRITKSEGSSRIFRGTLSPRRAAALTSTGGANTGTTITTPAQKRAVPRLP